MGLATEPSAHRERTQREKSTESRSEAKDDPIRMSFVCKSVHAASVTCAAGECYGATSKRRTLAAVTVSSISQYRTNTERERMAELGQVPTRLILNLLCAHTCLGNTSEVSRLLPGRPAR